MRAHRARYGPTASCAWRATTRWTASTTPRRSRRSSSWRASVARLRAPRSGAWPASYRPRRVPGSPNGNVQGDPYAAGHKAQDGVTQDGAVAPDNCIGIGEVRTHASSARDTLVCGHARGDPRRDARGHGGAGGGPGGRRGFGRRQWPGEHRLRPIRLRSRSACADDGNGGLDGSVRMSRSGSPTDGTVTCLKIDGDDIVIGGVRGGPPGSEAGFTVFLTDAGGAGTDSVAFDGPNAGTPADCDATSPTQTALTTGGVTILNGPSDSGTVSGSGTTYDGFQTTTFEFDGERQSDGSVSGTYSISTSGRLLDVRLDRLSRHPRRSRDGHRCQRSPGGGLAALRHVLRRRPRRVRVRRPDRVQRLHELRPATGVSGRPGEPEPGRHHRRHRRQRRCMAMAARRRRAKVVGEWLHPELPGRRAGLVRGRRPSATARATSTARSASPVTFGTSATGDVTCLLVTGNSIVVGGQQTTFNGGGGGGGSPTVTWFTLYLTDNGPNGTTGHGCLRRADEHGPARLRLDRPVPDEALVRPGVDHHRRVRRGRRPRIRHARPRLRAHSDLLVRRDAQRCWRPWAGRFSVSESQGFSLTGTIDCLDIRGETALLIGHGPDPNQRLRIHVRDDLHRGRRRRPRRRRDLVQRLSQPGAVRLPGRHGDAVGIPADRRHRRPGGPTADAEPDARADPSEEPRPSRARAKSPPRARHSSRPRRRPCPRPHRPPRHRPRVRADAAPDGGHDRAPGRRVRHRPRRRHGHGDRVDDERPAAGRLRVHVPRPAARHRRRRPRTPSTRSRSCSTSMRRSSRRSIRTSRLRRSPCSATASRSSTAPPTRTTTRRTRTRASALRETLSGGDDEGDARLTVLTSHASTWNAGALPDPTVPGAPTSVIATAGDRQATVTWTPPIDDGYSDLIAYAVTASPGGTTTLSDGPVGVATITGLDNGTVYTFTVSATNAVGTGADSATSNTVTPDGDLPRPGTRCRQHRSGRFRRLRRDLGRRVARLRGPKPRASRCQPRPVRVGERDGRALVDRSGRRWPDHGLLRGLEPERNAGPVPDRGQPRPRGHRRCDVGRVCT